MQRTSVRIAGLLVLLAVLFFLHRPADAQTTTTGAFGSRTLGGTSGTAAPRSTTTGQSSSTGASTQQMTMMQNVDGGVSGGERYVRGNRQNQFVGGGLEDARAVGVSQAGDAGSSQQFGNLFGGRNNVLGQLMQNSQFNQQSRSQPGRLGTTQLRIPIRLGFAPKPIATSKITAQLQTRLGRLPALTTVGPIEVDLEGETVVLRGMVASEGDRQLAQELLMLEPEVSLVKNELTVQAQSESSGEALPVPTIENRQ